MNDQMDNRPVICICEQCGEPIRGSNYTHFGDVYYVIDNCPVCENCVQDYLDMNCRKEG